jgi:RNA 2',3'-cyclic 3'-phosphodiesterase
MPRLFFALWPDDRVRDQIVARRDAIALNTGGRPMLPGTLHMTLVFVGEAEELKVPTLISCGDRIRAPGFHLKVDARNYFTKSHLAWLGVTDLPAELVHLNDMLRNEVTAAGFPLDDRPLQPHITVARNCMRFPSPESITPIEWPIESFVLVDSRNTPSGPMYRVLKYWPLDVAGKTQ